MNKTYFFFLLIITVQFANSLNQNTIRELKKSNFNKFISQNYVSVILFHSPKSQKSKDLLDIFSQYLASPESKKQKFAIGYIDTQKNPEILNNITISEYPTVKIYRNFTNAIIDCDIDKDPMEIFSYLNRKSFSRAIQISNKEELEKITNNANSKIPNVFFVTDNHTDIEKYKEIAQDTPVDYEFYYISIKEGKSYFEKFQTILPSLFIMNPLIDRTFIYNDTNFSSEKIHDFLKQSEYLPILAMQAKIVNTIMQGANSNYAIILYRNSTHAKNLDSEFQKMREFIKCKTCYFVLSDLSNKNNPNEETIAYYTGIRETQMPILAIVKYENGKYKKWVYADKLESTKMIEFYKKWKTGEIKSAIKSESIPEDNPGPIFKIVAKNFDAEVIKNDQDVIVLFLSRSCSACTEIMAIMNELVGELNERKDNSLKFVWIDGTKNEVEGIVINRYPTIKFYQSGNKKVPLDIEYTTRDELIKSIQKLHFPRAKQNQEKIQKTDL